MTSRLTVKQRLLSLALVPALLISLVMAVFFTYSGVKVLDSELRQRGTAMARYLAIISEYEVVSGQSKVLQSVAEAAVRQSSVKAVVMVDTEGKILAVSGKSSLPGEILRQTLVGPGEVANGGSWIGFGAPILRSVVEVNESYMEPVEHLETRKGSEVLGKVFVEIDSGEMVAKQEALFRNGLLIVLLGLAVSAWFVVRIANRLVRPLNHLVKAAHEVTNGNYSIQVPLTSSGEFGLLETTFNEMMSKLSGLISDLETRVSERTKALEEQKAELQVSNQAKNRFLAAASHDLRQPLHALSLFTADLQRQVRSGFTRDLDQLATQINSSVNSLTEVFSSLLDISRLDMGNVEPDVHSFPVQQIFDRIYLIFRRTALSHRVILRIRPSALCIRSDIHMVERMLANLVSNAVRYTPAGGRVLVVARERRGKVRIEVRDNGVGIAPEHQVLVFDEFFQVDNPARDQQKGLGLGLPIVQRLAKALGAELQLRSNLGKGTVFSVMLDKAEMADSGRPEEQGEGMLTLLVDVPEVARIAQLASSWGYRCKIETGVDHLQSASDGQRAIVFVSPEWVSQVRAELPPEWPVVAVTNGRIVAGEGVYVLHAPVRPARLRAMLQQLQGSLPKSIR